MCEKVSSRDLKRKVLTLRMFTHFELGSQGFWGPQKCYVVLVSAFQAELRKALAPSKNTLRCQLRCQQDVSKMSARCNKLPICPLVESNLQAFQELNETAEPENRIQEWLNGEKNKNKFFQSLRNVLKRYFSRANEEVSFQHLNDQNWLQLCSSCKSGFSDFN